MAAYIENKFGNVGYTHLLSSGGELKPKIPAVLRGSKSESSLRRVIPNRKSYLRASMHCAAWASSRR